MRLSYVYKLRPNKQQCQAMNSWLDMLRAHYNWSLADRIGTYSQQFIFGEYCDLRTKGVAHPVTCCIVKGGATGNPWKVDGKRRNAGLIQDAALVELKAARPWYKNIDSDVLQRNVARLNQAYANFFNQGRGFPKFKNRSNFRSFEYKPKRVRFDGDKVYLPKIGWMRYYNSRPFPEGFKKASVTIRKKPDGWYMSVRLEDSTVPALPIRKLEDVNTAVGLDMGITKLVHCSDGSDIKNPRFATNKKTRRTFRIRQRRVNRKNKGGKNRAKAGKKVAKLHQKVKERRTAYQWQVAKRIVNKADAVIVEELNIRGMMARCKPKKDEKGRFLPNGQARKRGLSRSIADASWGELMSKIEYVAAKSGKVLLKVDPKHTSQKCSACGHVDKANRKGEKFICTACGHFDHADKQAARNIKSLARDSIGTRVQKGTPGLGEAQGASSTEVGTGSS